MPPSVNIQKKPTPIEIIPADEFNLDLPDQDGNILQSYPPEVVDNLRQLIIRLGINQPFPARLALTSALRGEGVSYQTVALAATMANDSNANIGIVDLNWWYPGILAGFIDQQEGLAAVMSGAQKLDQVIIPSRWPNLSFIPAGELKASERAKAARSQALHEIMESLSQRFDHLILDVPAVLASSDAAPLISLADGCCLVIRQGVTQIEDVRSALDTISHLNIYGVILNQVRLATPNVLIRLFPQR
jgi:Mrp family chromosome partitioning ATPase